MRLLRLPEGATVDEVASVTGWQRHTVRGVFSGAWLSGRFVLAQFLAASKTCRLPKGGSNWTG
jgi:hypothetical protein